MKFCLAWWLIPLILSLSLASKPNSAVETIKQRKVSKSRNIDVAVMCFQNYKNAMEFI